MSVGGFVEDVRCEGSAAYIEPDVKVKVQFVPNDPYWNLQWGPQVIEADWAWNTTTGNQTVLVAVVDTGIDYTHSDLSNYVSLGYDWVNNDTDPMDDYGHGTHCAGIIAATLNNSVGVAGLAQVQIMAEKVLDSWGYGYWDWIANGIIHAADSGADVISMSLGSYSDSELVHEAVRYAYNAGVLIVAAAGNDNVNINAYPATYDEVIAVAATSDGDHKAFFSNWGEWIELSAPGVHIYSTIPGGYKYASGTSMACPHVAGLAALILSQYPNKTRDWLRIWLRYTCNDLGSEGFDVYFGHGRINARNAVEYDPPEHELIAYRWDTPPYIKPGTAETINATILNFGQAEETNVSVHLLANDTIVDSAAIGSLAPGISTEISLDWNVTIKGLYNVTLFISSVPNETNKEDNVLFKFLFVGLPAKALVLHSAGNIIGDTITNWQVLNSEWRRFGNKMVYIDYTTLNKEDITYDDIIATNADVLIISCAFDRFSGWEFTDSEIEAIERYVHEGHGLIATAGTFFYQVPNNNKLAPIFGLEESTIWGATGTDLLHLMNASHPVFTDVPDPLVIPYCGTALPWDGSWDSNELTGGEYLALGHYLESSIVEYRGLIYISPWLEIIPVHYHHHLQLLYNAITWSEYQKPEHEIAVSLQCPPHLEPGESVTVNASVMNLGLNNETDVELFLSIDGAETANMTSLILDVDQTVTLTYTWTPSMGKYNITAYAPPVPGEEEVYNNVKTKILRVAYPAKIGFVETHGENLHGEDLKTFYENLGHNVTTITSSLTPQLLEDFNIIVVGEDWSDNPWSPMEIAAVHDFISSGKGFIGIGDELSHSVQEILSNYGIVCTGYGGYPGSSNNLDHSHPIMEGVDSIYASNPINSLEVDPPGYWLAYDSYNENMLIAGAEAGGYVLCLSDDFAMAIHYDDNDVMLTNIIDWMTIKYEHDLAVSWDVPAWVDLSSSTMLNVTVWNTGLNNETNVNLHLIINNTIIKNETINQLKPGQSHTINYTWTPTETGKYNITAYTPPKPEEEKVTNNIITRTVYVFFYRRLDLSHEWFGGGVPMNWHADDGSWSYSLPFDFPFYGRDFRTIYVSSNGLITFTGSDTSFVNGISELTERLAIAPAWDDWKTYSPKDIYIWSNSTKVGIRWYVAALRNPNTVANFEAILSSSGIIQLNYGYNNDPISATIGISNGAGHIIAEDAENLNAINSIIFTPFMPEHNLVVELEAPSFLELGNSSTLTATVRNTGLNNETNVNLHLIINNTIIKNETINQLKPGQSHTINYTWTPTETGKYNITAYTPPKPEEESAADNVANILVRVGHMKGYILFDQTHGTDSILAYNNWVGNLTERWYIIDLHVTGLITQESLEGYDVFVIPQAHTAYSSTELSVIQNFVLDGGGLLVIGDDSPSLYTDLTSFASITWNSGGCGGLTTDITRHQVTEGVNTAYFGSPARLHTDLPASNIVRDDCGYPMIAVSEIGYGKVLAVADEHSINDEFIDHGDNLILACNGIDWLATPRAEHEIITQLEAPELIISSNTIQLNASAVNIGLSNETAVELVLILDGETKNSTLISLLTSGASHTITFVWNPTSEGTYNVTAYTSPVPGEADIENNRVTKLVLVIKIPEIPDLPSDRPAVYVNPQVLTKPIGETFTISIDIFNLTDATIPDPEDPRRNITLGNLYGFEIQFTWDTTIIQYVDHKVTIPVEEHPDGILHEPIFEIANIINEAGGIPGAHPETRALFVYTSMSPASPFNGNGTVFHMTFRIIGEGTSELRLVSTKLANRQGQAIFHTSLNGLVIVGTPPEGRDVSIVGMTHFPDFVYSGRVVNVTVVTANDGNVVETFNVTIYANSTNIGTQTVSNLPPRHNVTLTFTWNTTGLEPCINFSLSAEATRIPGEIDVVNNLFIGGVVRIKLRGDIDSNDVVDIYDIVMAINAYGSCRGDPDWNPDADIAPRYGIVDIFDLVTIASVFGSCG